MFVPHKLSYWPVVSRDHHDEASFKDKPDTIEGHVRYDEEILQDDEGREFISRARIYTKKIQLQQGSWVLPRLWVAGKDDPDPRCIPGAYRVVRVKRNLGATLNREKTRNPHRRLYTAYLR